VTTPPPPPPPSPSQFREETTDAQTNIRDSAGAKPMAREFDESVPTLQPLEKTGAHPSYDEARPRQDESGAVTLAQAQPGQQADAPDESKQSGGFSTPTPLPAPIPAAPDEFGGTSPPPTRLARPSPSGPVATGGASFAHDTNEPAFASAGPAPAFAEAFRTPIPGAPMPPGTIAKGTVPANPFSEISDGAIEYFVEWSLEQSTAPKPKVAEAHFANIVMATPRAEKRRSMRGPLLSGMAIGIFLGLPLGGAIVWFGRPLPPPVIVEKMPEAGPPHPSAVVGDLAVVAAAAPDLATGAIAVKPSAVAVKPSAVVVKPSAVAVKPSGATETPDKLVQPAKPEKAAKTQKGELVVKTNPEGATVAVDGEAQPGKTPLTLSLPAGSHEIALTRERYAPVTRTVDVPGKIDVVLKRPTATLHVDSEPAGGEVIVEGKPRGKTPVDVTLDAFQHYDVQVMLLGTKPWHKRVAVKPPQTDVTAKLSVVHNP